MAKKLKYISPQLAITLLNEKVNSVMKVYLKEYLVLCSNVQNLSNTEKYKVTLKLHRQFSHPHSERLLHLLQDCEINDEELKSPMKDLDKKSDLH